MRSRTRSSLVSMHGGTVDAQSDGPGRGAEIIVTLPTVALPRAETGAPGPIPTGVPGEHVQVLVVDDNEDAAELVADALQHMVTR